jgi:uncharacterized protein with NRDE domain
MCTLIALHRTVPGAWLVVAANRDEFYDRPAEGPTLRSTLSGRIAAPLDVEAGGTWLGVGRTGLFAAVTNVAGGERDPTRRSRGLLVVEALAATSAREAAEKVVNLPMGAYNPFNLFLADEVGAYAFTYQEVVRRVDPGGGVFVIGNGPLDAPVPTKLAELSNGVDRVAAGPADAVLDGLAELCRGHEPGGRGALDAVCVHTPGYGTRSSALLRLGVAGLEGSESVFHFAEGAPCQSGYEDFTPLLHELARSGRSGRGDQHVRRSS